MIPVVQLLRCFAVLVVFLYHLNPSMVSGGYLGVDIFFVISGFVITRSIAAKLERGEFQLTDFFVRRAFRILPPLLIVLCAIGLVALLFAGPVRYQQIFGSLPWAFAQVSNLYFARSSDYFAMDDALNPLLHTWSLGVEEQFYAVFPLLLIFIYKWKRLKESPGIAIAFCFLCSLVVSHLVYRYFGSNWDFFLPVSRFWEFLLGAILAFGRIPVFRGITRICVVGIAWSVIGFASMGYKEGFVEEDLLVLAPLLAVCVVITQSSLSKFDGKVWRPLLYVGDISYSLYLWHWPVICLFGVLDPFGGSLVLVEYAVVAFVTFALAGLQYRFLELPFREFGRKPRTTFPARARVLTNVLLVCLLLGGVSYALKSESDSGWRVVAAESHSSGSSQKRFEKTGIVDATRGLGEEEVSEVLQQVREAQYGAVLVGDSHAEHYWPSVEAYCRQRNLKVEGLFGDGFWAPSNRTRYNYSEAGRLLGQHGIAGDGKMSDWIWDFVCESSTIEIVFVAQNTNFYINGGMSDGASTGHLSFDVPVSKKKTAVELNRALYERDLTDLIIRLNESGKEVVLLGQIPQLNSSPLVVFAPTPRGSAAFGMKSVPRESEQSRLEFLPGVKERFKFERSLYSRLADRFGGVEFFDSHRVIQSPYGSSGEVLYYDDDHLNEVGSQWLAGEVDKFLKESLKD